MKCIRCGAYHDNKKICNDCLKEWSDMRLLIWEKMTEIYGVFDINTQKDWVKNTKKLESIWRKNKDMFIVELKKFNV